MHEGDVNALTMAIAAGASAKTEIITTITTAQKLTASQIATLQAELNAAIEARDKLAAAVTAAESALAELNAALNSGNAERIAAAITAAEQAEAKLSTAIKAEATANANLEAAIKVAIAASAPGAPQPQTQTPLVGTTVTTTVIPAGPITWAPGFGPNGVVASVQTAPTTGTASTTSNNTAVAGVQTVPQTGTQSGSAVAGVQNLPSTNTGDTSGLVGLGAALMALGAFLVRMPTKSRK